MKDSNRASRSDSPPAPGTTSSVSERWKTFREGYEVSSLGRVRSLDRTDARGHQRKGQLMTVRVGRSGYPEVNILNKLYLVHRLVLETFAGSPPSNQHRAHPKNGDRSDARLENLEWKTWSEIHAGRNAGMDNGRRKLTARSVKAIVNQVTRGKSQAEVAERFQVSSTTVSAIMGGKLWAHVTGL